MLSGIRGIEESSVYQGILRRGLAEGKAEWVRQSLLCLGSRMLGPTSPAIEAQIAALKDADHLRALLVHVPDVSSWAELSSAPADQSA